ncbi:MAG: hypothetical protein LBT93_03610, partial [Treponema sp.]|nr:hypothetical protein [Treponema sp.]
MKNKGKIIALLVSFAVMTLVFSSCNLVMGNVPEYEKPGVYRIVNDDEKEWVMSAGEITLANCLETIRQAPLSGSGVDEYEIILRADEEITPKYISPLVDNYSDTVGAKISYASKKITLKGLNKNITIKQKAGRKSGDDYIPLFVIGTYDTEKWESSSK